MLSKETERILNNTENPEQAFLDLMVHFLEEMNNSRECAALISMAEMLLGATHTPQIRKELFQIINEAQHLENEFREDEDPDWARREGWIAWAESKEL
jgi:uncharacterized protein (DUF305 family)